MRVTPKITRVAARKGEELARRARDGEMMRGGERARARRDSGGARRKQRRAMSDKDMMASAAI